jgi:hypothetical protein
MRARVAARDGERERAVQRQENRGSAQWVRTRALSSLTVRLALSREVVRGKRVPSSTRLAREGQGDQLAFPHLCSGVLFYVIAIYSRSLARQFAVVRDFRLRPRMARHARLYGSRSVQSASGTSGHDGKLETVRTLRPCKTSS